VDSKVPIWISEKDIGFQTLLIQQKEEEEEEEEEEDANRIAHH
jgi:hypothetical protein